MRQRTVVSIVALSVAVIAIFVLAGFPYGHFHWSDLVWAQDGDSPYGEPGCQIEIPDGSVVGQFVVNTYFYWEPSLGSASTYQVDDTSETPKTAWVIGQDESETFYKVVWACQYLWVPKDTMGPNPDAVWQSTPLPIRIVE